jgi:addiction module RelE/StbE family toxin
MWEIYEHGRLSRRLPRLPVEILKRYEKWKDIVQISGPAGLGAIKGFHDEALLGEWKGLRSSRLGLQYRVIYKVEDQQSRVFVMNITAHDYRKK